MEWDGAYYWAEQRKIRVLDAISKREKGRLESGDCWCHEDCFNSQPRKGTRIFPRNRKSCPHFWRGPGNFEKTGDCEYYAIQILKKESARYSQFYHDLRGWLRSSEAQNSLRFTDFSEEKSHKYSDFIIKHSSENIDWEETEILIVHKNRSRKPRTTNFIIVDLNEWTADQLSDFQQFSVRKIIEEFEQLIGKILRQREDELERIRLIAESERIRMELEEERLQRRKEIDDEKKKEQEEEDLRRNNRITRIGIINKKSKEDFEELKDLLDEILVEHRINYRKKYYDSAREYHERILNNGIQEFPWDLQVSDVINPHPVNYSLEYSDTIKSHVERLDMRPIFTLSSSSKWNDFLNALNSKCNCNDLENSLIRSSDIVYLHNLVEEYCISFMDNREREILDPIGKRMIEELRIAKQSDLYQPTHSNWIEFEKYTKFVHERMTYYRQWQEVYHKSSYSNPDSYSALMFDKSEDITEYIESHHFLHPIGEIEFKRHLYESRQTEIDGSKLIESCSDVMKEVLAPGYSMLGITAQQYNKLNENEKIKLLEEKFT